MATRSGAGRWRGLLLGVVVHLLTGAAARADDAPYTAPFGLRGVNAATAVRAETAYGLNAGTSSTVVQYLTASYAVRPDVGVLVRGGWVDFIPHGTNASQAFTNVTVAGV